MAINVRFKLAGRTVAIPHVGIAKTLGRNAVAIFSRHSPVRTGLLKGSWSYRVSRGTAGLFLVVSNPVEYASLAFDKKRVARAGREVAASWKAIKGQVK